MTRLQYLKCRNRDKIPYQRLSDNLVTLLRSHITVNAIQMYRTTRFPTSWGNRNCPRAPLCFGGIYRISDAVRPRGIPEDVHRRYDS